MSGDGKTGVTNFPAAKVVVVMVPFVAQGHLNQLLHLSDLISGYKIPVHFVCTTTHLRQARSRHCITDSPSAISGEIKFHEFPTPPFTSPPPHPSIPFPTHLQPSFDSTLHLRRPIADLILSLSHTTKRIVVVHDPLMSYVVQDVKTVPNAETYIFRPTSAFYSFWFEWEYYGRPFLVDPELLNRLPSEDGTFSPEFNEFIKLQLSHLNFHVGELYDSSRVIEGEFLEYLDREEISGKKKLWAVGPFNPVEIVSSDKRHTSLQWLDKQAANSVLYVSFGTTTTFTGEQIRELATGLERSEQRFIWVLRVADRGDVFEKEDRIVELPHGFEERVDGRGLVVREWVPQMEILDHFATGGFMSHCGWNSCMESISMGVPMATWPMHSDQPRNAFLISDVLKIGVVVKDWGGKNELVTSVVVEEAIKTLMASKEGEEIHQRAAKLSDKVKRSVAEGGVSCKEIDSFISYIMR